MTRERFEEIAQQVFNELPDIFGGKVENVHIVIEDYPDEDISSEMHTKKTSLLGLYQGIPLTHRGTGYGTHPTTPDKISLYHKNIEASCRNDEEVAIRVKEVLLHELGHYFGMNETEIRNAMRNYNPSH